MVIKVYVSGISASKEVKKRQQRALLILDSVNVEYEPIDITEPGREDERMTVQQAFKTRTDKVIPLPPQFFNDDQYCGDYEDFNAAVDVDRLLAFLKLDEAVAAATSYIETTNGHVKTTTEEEEDDTAASGEHDKDVGNEKGDIINDYGEEESAEVNVAQVRDSQEEDVEGEDVVAPGHLGTKRKESDGEEVEEEEEEEGLGSKPNEDDSVKRLKSSDFAEVEEGEIDD